MVGFESRKIKELVHALCIVSDVEFYPKGKAMFELWWKGSFFAQHSL